MIGGFVGRAAALVASGVVGAVAYDGIKRLARSNALHGAAVAATSCALRGAEGMLKYLEQKLGTHAGTNGDKYFLRETECLASCGTAPCMQVNEDHHENLTKAKYQAAVDLEDLPESAKAVIRQNWSDEQRHLDWIRDALDQKVWERPQPSAP